MNDIVKINKAIISVSDKTGIVDFAYLLKERHVVILSTGGTAVRLKEHDIPVMDIEMYTGMPEMFGGRVKTLHPKIHGGILMREGDEDEAKAHNIMPIDLVVVDLYPFFNTAMEHFDDLDLVMENIDIGGVTLIRAAAKNFKRVVVVNDFKQYKLIIDEIDEFGGVRSETRFKLARTAFENIAIYDDAIGEYFSRYAANIGWNGLT